MQIHPVNKSGGNVLFLILIAVALFAALSYAVTSSGRGGGKTANTEKKAMAASQILQYSASIQQAVQRLGIVKGCEPTKISFHWDSDGDGVLENTTDDNHYNPSSPTDFSCHIFHPNGGGIVRPTRITDEVMQTTGWASAVGSWYSKYRGYPIIAAGSDFNDNNVSDIVLLYIFLDEEMCRDMQARFNGSTPPLDDARTVYPLIDLSGTLYGDTPANPTLSSQVRPSAGCAHKNDDNYWGYYQVIINR